MSAEIRKPATALRLLMVVQVALIIGSVAAVAFLATQTGPLLRQRNQLRGEIQAAQGQLEGVQTRIREMQTLQKTLEERNRRLQEEKRQLEADRQVLNRSLLNVGNAQQTQDAVESAVESIARTSPPNTISPRVYIHVAADAGVRIARDGAEALQRAGFIVPSIQRVQEVPPRPELRYFRREDEDVAKTAVRALGDRIPGLQLRFFPGAERSRRIRPRHLELWF